MDRNLYISSFRKDISPLWKCPTCDKGILRIEKDSFVFKETIESKRNQEDGSWFPQMIDYIYSCLLVCANDACKDVVVSTGKGFVEEEYDYDHEGNPLHEYIDYFQPNYFCPSLKLFSVPNGTPEDVIEEVQQSFELFFCNPASSLNHIRIALENLLTYLRVKRYKVERSKRKPMSLHERINFLPDKFQEIKDHCLAIKWSGNAGSHSGEEITKDDVMDVYEIMDEVLREIFKSKKKEIRSLVKQINKKKGPKSKKRSKRKKM